MKPQKILINYANDAFKKAQKINSKTGLEVGGFDRVIEYGPKDIDKKFYEKNKHILDKVRLGGYALWKPYIILKTLNRKDIEEGDYVFYCDSGAYFVNSINHLIPLFRAYNQDIVTFGSKNDKYLDRYWTKRDALILMSADDKKVYNTPGAGAGIMIAAKKTRKSIVFFREFLKYAQDERIITDKKSVLGEEYEGFIENRHDQTILGILVKKKGLKYFRCPHQAGNKELNLFSDKYPQILVSTRKNNRSILEKLTYQKACSKNGFDFFVRVIKMPLKKITNKLRGIK